MYKVKLATLAYKIFHDCTPPSMGYILTKKTSSIYHLHTTNTVTEPRFNTHLMKNSIAFRASIVWSLLTPDLAKTSNVKNYTRMAINPTNYIAETFTRNLRKQCLTIMIMIFYIIKTILLYFYSLGFSLNARHHNLQRFNYHCVEISVVAVDCYCCLNSYNSFLGFWIATCKRGACWKFTNLQISVCICLHPEPYYK